MIERSAALSIVIASIQEVFAQNGDEAPAGINEETVLVGLENHAKALCPGDNPFT